MTSQDISIKSVGIGTRVLNFLVDTFLVFIISKFIVYEIWEFYMRYWQYPFVPYYIAFWLFLIVYYFLFESFFKRTPGKWLTGTYVVNNKGGKPSVFQILIRSVVRIIIIDSFFIPFLNDKTLHDYLSKTNVITKGV